MGLVYKFRVLMGALVHKPFMPRPGRIELEDGPALAPSEGARRDSKNLDAPEGQGLEEERVADLIARRQRDGGD
jgi:hypothetical protein